MIRIPVSRYVSASVLALTLAWVLRRPAGAPFWAVAALGMAADLALDAMCRSVEISTCMALGDPQVPAPLKPEPFAFSATRPLAASIFSALLDNPPLRH